MPEETITLRESARRLARTRNPKGTNIESGKLLNALRSGDLNAGFYFLDGTTWMEIPYAYWRGINSNKFRIGRKQGDSRSGTYRVKANKFPIQVANALCGSEQTSERQSIPSRERLVAVIRETTKWYEVTIKTKDFLDYLQRQGLEENRSRTNVGRRRKEGWRELCSYMAAYFAAHQRDRGDELVKIEQAQADIIKIAKDDQVPDLPDETTIGEQISKAIGFLERPEFKLKKPSAADVKSNRLPQKTKLKKPSAADRE
jgi:hypothetical protein